MKSLRATRLEKGLSLISIERQLGVHNVNLSEYESGRHSPGELIRKRLEFFFGEKINWLDVPINYERREPACTWNDAEREFRYFIHSVASLPNDEKSAFIKSVCKHLNNLIK